MLNVAPIGKFEAIYVKVSPNGVSGSVAEMVNSKLTPSSIVFSPMASRIGALFTLWTVMVMSSESISEPSVTSKCTPGYVPTCARVGVQLKVLVPALKLAPVGKLEAQ